jgi:predicted nucleic acid-binding protein
LWHKEIANVLSLAARSGRIPAEKVTAGSRLVESLPVDIATLTPAEIHGPVVDLVRWYRLTVYDASYLYIAMRDAAPLATMDKELLEAAPKAGVPILKT